MKGRYGGFRFREGLGYLLRSLLTARRDAQHNHRGADSHEPARKRTSVR